MIKRSSKRSLLILIATLVIIGALLCVFLAGLTVTSEDEPAIVSTNKSAIKIAPNGLRYMIITPASKDAAKPRVGQKVVVNYTGWIDDDDQPGQKFDSSYDHDAPFVFTVGKGQVIKGWDLALLDMRVGEKRRIFLPPELAYGSRGVPKLIPPFATLIFDVELVEIK